MISSPTTPQLIETLRIELAERVGPHVDDPAARVALDMSLALLTSIANRSRVEVAWMCAESASIQRLAARLIEAGADDGRLAAIRWSEQTGLSLAEVSERYEQSAEVLCVCAELAFGSTDPHLIDATRAVFGERLEHEAALTGGYEAVGRA